MKTLIVALAGLVAVVASSTYAADSSSRTYGNPSCSDRNANSADCVIQDGPPRRSAFGEPAAGPKDTPPPASKPTGAAAGKGVGAGNNNTSGSGSAAR
jgi:hypothetical protein